MWRNWIRSFFGHGSRNAGMQETLKGVSGMLAATEEREIGCDEAFELLDQYAEIVARGDDPTVLLPLVKHHLDICKDCREELQALLRILEDEKTP
jgi:hypothetical protein